MSMRIIIKDGTGTEREVAVSEEFGINVSIVPADVPKASSASRFRFYSAVLGSEGANGGVTNMNVDGSVTPQEFYIGSDPDYDIRVMGISVVIADTAVIHSKFGNVNALTNGWVLKVVEVGEEYPIVDEAKTGGEVIAQSSFHNAYGDGATAFELANWSGTGDAQTIHFPISAFMPMGIRIGRGTQDKIVSVVQDDLTGLQEFTVRTLGYRHYPR